jgi:hypothetical protein
MAYLLALWCAMRFRIPPTKNISVRKTTWNTSHYRSKHKRQAKNAARCAQSNRSNPTYPQIRVDKLWITAGKLICRLWLGPLPLSAQDMSEGNKKNCDTMQIAVGTD